MKRRFLIFAVFAFLITNECMSQYSSTTPNQTFFTSYNNRHTLKLNTPASPGASMGFNVGVASIESEVGFAIGAFAELKSNVISFVPQANFWTVKKQTNFELAGLVRFYLTQRSINPYVDGGLGINFFNSGNNNITKLSVDFGAGIEMTNVARSSFHLLFDGKYKILIKDNENLSCVIVTAGVKFPLK